MKIIQQLFQRLFSTSAAGLYMIIFAVVIGAATFIENDYGTSSAQKVVYKMWWFELLLLLFGISILVNIFRYRMIQQRKWATFAFHSSIIIILLGAGITRYFGYEGMMHIREGSAANTFLSFDEHLVFKAQQNGEVFKFAEPVLFATLGNNHFKESYLINNQEVTVEVMDFMPNPKEVMVEDEAGVPTLKIVIGGNNGREKYYLPQGKQSRIRGTLFNFRNRENPAAFNIKYENAAFFFKAPTNFSQMVMATQQKTELTANEYHPLVFRSLYQSGQQRFVFGDFSTNAKMELTSTDRKMKSTSTGGLQVKVSSGGEEMEQYIFGAKGIAGRPRVFSVNNLNLTITYGAKEIELPFALRLREFILEKYPGTNSASSYASEVTLLDPSANVEQDFRIFMNNILDYGGYRFFQSSFDQDELGTWLSVNHDWWGTWVSYLGYAILTIGMFMTFFDKKSRFQQLARNIKKLQHSRNQVATLLIGFFIWNAPTVAAEAVPLRDINAIDATHAASFGYLIMQDHRGRMKPMDTYASEILRKLSRKESLHGLTPEQVILGMATQPKKWYQIPLIKTGKHKKTIAILPTPINGNLLTYSDFFAKDGSYKLREHVRGAYNMPKKDRGVFEKEMMKLDEKINICSMVFSGNFMKLFPVVNDPNNTWTAPNESEHHQTSPENAAFANKFYAAYIPTLEKALVDHDWNLANRLVGELGDYQHEYGGEVMPSKMQRDAEILLNRLDVFGRLAKGYGLLSLAFLGLLFTSVFKPHLPVTKVGKGMYWLFVGAVLFHLLGLGLRWYVSERAPWSNGYESMIYIGCTTVLAGLFFGRKSLGGLAATNLLAATILFVAGLSWLDPEITPLVPVLKSYWLTIHVSLEAGSYGFLMLGAIIGVLNLLLMIFRTKKNDANVTRIINEMTQISEMTLLGGLFMISVGTYLGGVWANESWGRYWGWDAKETWALVTILVYSFILHMRFIPGFRGPYAFNVASLFGWASVIMTYFGVNYYLSGLHSYAAGDPVPIPTFVYYAVAILTGLGLLAGWRNRKFS
ncbi:MAG: cytochrome c biogenesis protein CcsA [Saprospiraceae bacterium]